MRLDDVEARLQALEMLLAVSKATPGPPGADGAAGVAGPPGPAGPTTGPVMAALMMNEDLASQVNGIVTTFTVSKPFIAGKALVFLAGAVQENATFNGPAGTITLPTAPTTDDLADGTLRFWGVSA